MAYPLPGFRGTPVTRRQMPVLGFRGHSKVKHMPEYLRGTPPLPVFHGYPERKRLVRDSRTTHMAFYDGEHNARPAAPVPHTSGRVFGPVNPYEHAWTPEEACAFPSLFADCCNHQARAASGESPPPLGVHVPQEPEGVLRCLDGLEHIMVDRGKRSLPADEEKAHPGSYRFDHSHDLEEGEIRDELAFNTSRAHEGNTAAKHLLLLEGRCRGNSDWDGSKSRSEIGFARTADGTVIWGDGQVSLVRPFPGDDQVRSSRPPVPVCDEPATIRGYSPDDSYPHRTKRQREDSGDAPSE